MALINCPECKIKISNKSTNCVHCGFPINDKPFKEVVPGESKEGCFLQTLNCGCILTFIVIGFIIAIIILIGISA